MYMTEKKGSIFLWYLVLSSAISLGNTTAGVQIQMKMAVGDAALELSTIHQNAIALFFATQTEESCAPLSCPLTLPTDITFEPIANGVLSNATTNTFDFDIAMNIKLPDNSRALSVKTSSNNGLVSYGLSQVKLNSNLRLQPLLGLHIKAYDVVYTRDAARPLVCGDSMVTGDEVCDDGNVVNGDGCSSTCTLETGYTCFSAVRENVGTRGKMAAWATNSSTGIKSLVVSSVDEFCTSDDICVQDASVWDPDYWWTKAYSGGSIPRVSLAPGGFYCKDFCTDTFSPAKFYEFRESCIPTGKDECSRGESTCDINAYCTEPGDQVGFECECDKKYFVSKIDGAVCATSGVEVEFQMGGMISGTDASDRANMADARLKLIDELISQQYLNEQSSPALLIEGVKQYPIDLVTPLIEDASSPLFMRSLWRIVLRAPDVHLNLLKIAQGTIFDDTATWARVFNDSDKYMVNEVGQCANDRARSCDAGNPSCLNGAACVTDRADFTLNKLDAGGVTAPLQVESSGMEVLSVDYDITQSAFSVRMRYNDEVPGVMDAVFLSHMGVDQNPLLLPTFRSDEFPCLPLGTQQFQNQRDNSGTRHFFMCSLDLFVYFIHCCGGRPARALLAEQKSARGGRPAILFSGAVHSPDKVKRARGAPRS